MAVSRYKKRLWIGLCLILLVILIGAGGLTAFLIRYSATNQLICHQCHPEHTEMWKNSHGHPAEETSCYECHSKGIEVVPTGWNILRHARDQWIPPEYLADDELTSQRCLECHRDILNFGYKVKKKVIEFNHRHHNEEGLICVDCHRNAGHEYMMDGSNRPTVSECLECHLREFEGPPMNRRCLNCHDVMLAQGKSFKKNLSEDEN